MNIIIWLILPVFAFAIAKYVGLVFYLVIASSAYLIGKKIDEWKGK